ncbi:hypothetical protein MESS4_120283 [Mesorhizobium sp. STM 4661]|nr:hypothetical protein MESS4_120283 [Mesorhizobium sp. STM 4661]
MFAWQRLVVTEALLLACIIAIIASFRATSGKCSQKISDETWMTLVFREINVEHCDLMLTASGLQVYFLIN